MSALLHRLQNEANTQERSLTELDDGPRATFARVLAEARALAIDLARRGVSPHDRVALLLPPGVDWARAFMSVLFARAIAVPIALASPAPEVHYTLADSGAKACIVAPDLAPLVPSSVLSLDAHPRLAPLADPSLVRRDESLLTGGVPLDHDGALMLYTSGTTGRPKGALLSHANLSAQTRALREAWAMSPDDVLLHVLPMHHLHGVVVAFLTAFTTPADIRFMKFSAEKIPSALEGATVFMAVPTMYRRIVDHDRTQGEPARARLAAAARRLRLATSGSAALPATLARAWEAIAGSVPLERYGMTEIGMALSNPLDPLRRRPATVGFPLPSVDLEIVDDAGVPGDGPGQIRVRGPSVMRTYHGRPEATREAFQGSWFMTGDVAVRDAEGYVRLLGRASTDILKSGGEKISALEVEEVLREHEAIEEVAVVGIEDADWGERVVAAVVARPGRADACATEAIRAWAKSRLAPFKVPRDVVVLDALPRNAMGKVLKSEVSRAVAARLEAR